MPLRPEEKARIASFLDISADFLKDGYARERELYNFENDASSKNKKESLPLAYLVDEDEDPRYAETLGSHGADSADGFKEFPCSTDSLEKIAAEINVCKLCGLSAARKKAVPGEGVSNPLVMVIGEGPGADEDASGKPFVGRAGQLLDKMLASIGLYRNENCFIANMVKCRPPNNRDPEQQEISHCSDFLNRQIALLRPKIILCAGRVAAQKLLQTSRGINSLRGAFAEYITQQGETIPVLPTFHPSALLRDESLKRPAWEDLKLLKSKIAAPDVPSGDKSGFGATEI